uniref:Putative dinitrification protein NorD n=1 Tax=Magnetococcus massalia (strain MO-1) TaxID=451514 RepID=A0A1S7LLQ2_MAGMO|nr:putative dinitrification protein NorD [Candidatus Magnetococcus massalia]
MEEWVGGIWDRWITRKATDRHPDAVVTLSQMERRLKILFHALGGAPGVMLRGVGDQAHGKKRRGLQKLAGTGSKAPWGWRGEQHLNLPDQLDIFPTVELNQQLYQWLVALMIEPLPVAQHEVAWLSHCSDRTAQVLARYPGMGQRYARLLEAHLAQRQGFINEQEIDQQREAQLVEILCQPGDRSLAEQMPSGKKALWPIPLWPHPQPPQEQGVTARTDDPDEQDQQSERQAQSERDSSRKQAKRNDIEERKDGVMIYRFEALFSWTEMVKVNRPSDEEEEEEEAKRAADDMESLDITRSGQAAKKAFKFDLDLPSEAADDRPLGPGIKLPEWDYRSQSMLPDYCLLQTMEPRDSAPCQLPEKLRPSAAKVRAQVSSWRPDSIWLKRQWDGSEVDLDAAQEFVTNRQLGAGPAEMGLYRNFRRSMRDMACLLLADLSLSTDSWVSDEQRVVDVVQESMFLFAEALSATEDRFGLYGFSSKRRDHVRFLHIKGFDEPYSPQVRGRIDALRPGYYTRMGAGIRQSTALLSKQPAARRLLLILSDGKPNDLDIYEGRYGVEDTRMAVKEARQAGVKVFCVTIDKQASGYATTIFGQLGYRRIAQADRLPSLLPQIYLNLTQS